MRRAIDLAIKAVAVFVFVVCVGCLCWRLRRKAPDLAEGYANAAA